MPKISEFISFERRSCLNIVNNITLSCRNRIIEFEAFNLLRFRLESGFPQLNAHAWIVSRNHFSAMLGAAFMIFSICHSASHIAGCVPPALLPRDEAGPSLRFRGNESNLGFAGIRRDLF